MSKKVKFPDGAITQVSDAVAQILAQRPGHRIVGEGEPFHGPQSPAIPRPDALVDADARLRLRVTAED